MFCFRSILQISIILIGFQDTYDSANLSIYKHEFKFTCRGYCRFTLRPGGHRLRFFVWREIVSTACPCLLLSPPPNFQTFHVRQAHSAHRQAKMFLIQVKNILHVSKQMLLVLCLLASFAMQIWILVKLASKSDKLQILMLASWGGGGGGRELLMETRYTCVFPPG